MTRLVVDTSELDAIARHSPTDATTNPTLLLKYSRRAELNPFLSSGHATMALLDELMATASVVSRGA